MRRIVLALAALFAFAQGSLPAVAGSSLPAKPPLSAYARVVSGGGTMPVAYGNAERGCWQSYNPVYGLYRVAFCLNAAGNGTYRVIGGGYDCQGRSSWQDQAGTIVYQMHHGSCGASADWTADQIVCRRAGGITRNLSCTYAPAVRHQRPTGFTAFRQ